MTVQLTTTDAQGVTVVRLLGVAGPSTMDDLGDQVAGLVAAGERVVVDVEDVVLGRPDVVRRFLVRATRRAGSLVFCAPRVTSRRLLLSAGVAGVIVFHDLDIAVGAVGARQVAVAS